MRRKRTTSPASPPAKVEGGDGVEARDDGDDAGRRAEVAPSETSRKNRRRKAGKGVAAILADAKAAIER